MMRIGHGYDVHRLTEGRKLILGGVEIPYEKGLLGHSDADVLTHAVMDALLGAAGLGDIGRHFPDNDDRFLGADSLLLLAATVPCRVENRKRVAIFLQMSRKGCNFAPTYEKTENDRDAAPHGAAVS
jgi:2-C-methyl-D-erythritol 2,4-cyclodiphosphate synthase